MRKIISGAAAVALCMLSVQPAMAQDHRLPGFEGLQGATATVNLRVPLGARGSQEGPTYGVTVAYDRAAGSAVDAHGPESRRLTVADIRFSGDELRNARLGAVDFANPDYDQPLYLSGWKTAFMIWLVATFALGAVCFLGSGCGNESSRYVPPPPTPTEE